MEILKEDKLCVCCGKQFRGDVSFCPDDDDELVSLSENPFEGTQFEREFQILSVLGWGGWGIVYRARDILIERNVAIKMLHSHLATNQQRQRRFKREAVVLADLSHPNIATILKYNTLPDSRPFVVMEFLAGKTLEETLDEMRTLPVADAIAVFIDTCDALSFAHSKGVVHRDIKPSNLMLTKDHHGQTTVKVLDFGLAKIFSLDEGTNLTRTGETIGTPNYMSPEQCRGQVLDQRSDVYSLGCVMYETLTGVKPVTGASFYDCMQRHVSGDVTPPSVAARGGNVGADLEQIIMKAMAKDPDNRYQSANRLKSDLEFFASTISAPQGVPGRRSRNFDGRAEQQQKGPGAPVLWLAAVVLLSVSAMAAVLVLQKPQQRAETQAMATGSAVREKSGTGQASVEPGVAKADSKKDSKMIVIKGDSNKRNETKPDTVDGAKPVEPKPDNGEKPGQPKIELVAPKITIEPNIQLVPPKPTIAMVAPPTPAPTPTRSSNSDGLTPTKIAILDSESRVFLDNLAMGFTPPKSPAELLAMSEAWTRKYGYNARVQNEMRHHYMTRDRKRMRECVELVFKMDIMDEYEFQIVSGWKMDNPAVAIETLNQAASEYSGYPHTESACYIRIGDIYMKKGDKGQAVYNYQRALAVRPETTYTALARTRIQTAQRW